MKVGDKVFVELEVKEFNDFTFTDKYFSTYERKEIITQLPIQEGRWMMVSHKEELAFERRFVVGKVHGLFITFNACKGFQRFRYAKELPVKTKLTMQEIADKFGLDAENIEICTE